MTEWIRVILGVAITVFLLATLRWLHHQQEIIDGMVAAQQEQQHAIDSLVEFSTHTNARLKRLEGS